MPAVKIKDRREPAVLRMINHHATDNQRERFAAGLLPEDELLSLARFELFKPFMTFRRWVKLEHGDVRHDGDRMCPPQSVEYTTHEPAVLTHDEWATFKKITSEVSRANSEYLAEHGVAAIASLVEHVGRCINCGAEAFGRSVNIRIEWAGRPLSREYTLEAA